MRCTYRCVYSVPKTFAFAMRFCNWRVVGFEFHFAPFHIPFSFPSSIFFWPEHEGRWPEEEWRWLEQPFVTSFEGSFSIPFFGCDFYFMPFGYLIRRFILYTLFLVRFLFYALLLPHSSMILWNFSYYMLFYFPGLFSIDICMVSLMFSLFVAFSNRLRWKIFFSWDL